MDECTHQALLILGDDGPADDTVKCLGCGARFVPASKLDAVTAERDKLRGLYDDALLLLRVHSEAMGETYPRKPK